MYLIAEVVCGWCCLTPTRLSIHRDHMYLIADPCVSNSLSNNRARVWVMLQACRGQMCRTWLCCWTGVPRWLAT